MSKLTHALDFYIPKIFMFFNFWYLFTKSIKSLRLSCRTHIRTVTEGALIKGLVENSFYPNLTILSDYSKQFTVFLHALCCAGSP